MKSKKGFVIGQVFIFILVLVTFALIMIFGYKTISGFLESGEEVEFVQFKNDLEGSINRLYTEFGAVRVEKFSLPLRFQKICFVDLNYQGEDSTELLQSFCQEDPLNCGVWEDAMGGENVDQNLFLTPVAKRKIKIEKMAVNGGFFCEEVVGGTFRLRLEGKGHKTELSKVSENNG